MARSLPLDDSSLVPDWLRAVHRSCVYSTSEPITEENRNVVIESNDGGIHTSITGEYREPVWIDWAHSIRTLRRSELDEKYPHVCFKCKNPLKFKELLTANTETDKDYLEKLWKSEAVEFYCCDCYRNKDKPQKSLFNYVEEHMREFGRRWGFGVDFNGHWEPVLRGTEVDEIWVDELENMEFGYDDVDE